MKVGYHAPPKGSRSGVADYAETLRVALGRFCSVEGAAQGGAGGADVQLYHLGNNRLHEEIYAEALRTPGLVVLHDAVLQHLMLGTRSHEEYIAEWVYNYGIWRRELGEELWLERGKSAVDPRYFQFAMLRRIVERSRGVIVHNPGAAAMAREHGAARVFTIPHFFETETASNGRLAGDVEGLAFRQRMGIEAGATLFGIFGFMRETKRVPACIAAFRRLHAIRPRTAMLLAGEAVSSDLARFLAAEVGSSPEVEGIYRTGHLNETDLRAAATAVDCCLNLRYPGAGETSGIAIRLMGAGKPVIATDNAENADIPSSAMLRVKAGIAEVAELFEHMVLVTEYPGIARAVGIEARVHIERCHGLEAVVRQYWEALCAVTS